MDLARLITDQGFAVAVAAFLLWIHFRERVRCETALDAAEARVTALVQRVAQLEYRLNSPAHSPPPPPATERCPLDPKK